MLDQPLSEPPGVDLDRKVALSDGSHTTVGALRARVVILEPGIYKFSELEKPTPASLQAMTAKIEELASGLAAFGIMIDLSESQGSTTAEYRKYIPRHFAEWAKRSGGALRQVALPMASNAVVRVAAKFIVSRIADAPFVVYRSPEEALRGLREAIAAPR